MQSNIVEPTPIPPRRGFRKISDDFMSEVATQILKHLELLIGLKLCIARRAADMRGFHFGDDSPEQNNHSLKK